MVTKTFYEFTFEVSTNGVNIVTKTVLKTSCNEKKLLKEIKRNYGLLNDVKILSVRKILFGMKKEDFLQNAQIIKEY